MYIVPRAYSLETCHTIYDILFRGQRKAVVQSLQHNEVIDQTLAVCRICCSTEGPQTSTQLWNAKEQQECHPDSVKSNLDAEPRQRESSFLPLSLTRSISEIQKERERERKRDSRGIGKKGHAVGGIANCDCTVCSW